MNRSAAPSTVLILGADGRLGLAAARAFAAAGWQVLAQARREAAPGMPAFARLLRVLVEDAAALAAQSAGASVVVHTLNPHYVRWEREAMPLLMHALDQTQVLGARLMLPGNVQKCGLNLSVPTLENAAQRPHTSHGRVRVAMEAEIEGRCRAGALRATVLTAGNFYGAGTGTVFELVILKSLSRGRLAYPGPLDVPHAWAYLLDLARAFVALAEAPALPGFFRCHFAGHTLTGAQLLDGVERAAAQLGLRPAAGFKRGGTPWGLIRALGLVMPLLRALADMSYLWRVPYGLDESGLRAVLGDAVPHTAPEAALLETVRLLARPDAVRAAGAPGGQAAWSGYARPAPDAARRSHAGHGQGDQRP